uniref:Uncharacterized protein n=1 Tax=Tanacetum cinerariifolium TaxID=118510 RepID=A0A6L2K5S6_TANCI|nr:hypothetical protein [Tanacetum cinerariifolium]
MLGYENYNAVPPPYTGNFMPPTPDLSFTGLDEFVNKPVVENCKGKSSEEEPNEKRIDVIDANEEITLINVQDDVEMFDVNALYGEEVFVARKNKNVIEEADDVAQVSTAHTVTTEEITLAQALEALKTSKPKIKRIIIQEPGESTTIIPKQQSQDKGKAIMIEEPVKTKKKDQIKLDEEATKRLQVEFHEEERLIDADHQLAERLQAQEQEELSDAKKANYFNNS